MSGGTSKFKWSDASAFDGYGQGKRQKVEARRESEEKVLEIYENVLDDALAPRYWDDQLKMDGVVTHKTSEHVVNNTWAALGQEDHEVTISTKELCKVYGPVLAPVLKLKVGHYEASLVAEFGPNPVLTIFSPPLADQIADQGGKRCDAV